MATSEYHPTTYGEPPSDWDGSLPVYYRDLSETWAPTYEPLWATFGTYRYRVRTGLTGKSPSVIVTDDLTESQTSERPNSLPEDPDIRNSYPMADGLLDYFPNALAEVSRVSHYGNQQHNPGQPMHWARGKSTDHRNKILRHLIDAGGKDNKGIRHSAYLAWRALANLQQELEDQEGVPMSRGSKPAA